MIKKMIPDSYVSSIYDIPYTNLYAKGIRLILTDLDNTLISYKETKPTQELFKWKEEIEAMGFEIIIVSNSRKDRVKNFATLLDLKYVKFAKKPSKLGLKKAIRIASKKYELHEIIEFGDQLMTDVFGSKRLKIESILVKAIDNKTEKWVTRNNRRIERFFLKRIEKKFPNLYLEKLEEYVKENHN